MKAAIRYRYCKPEQLTIADISIPTPGDDEILVKVKATTVSRTDCGVLTGWPFAIRFFTGLFKPARPITGTDFAGTVVTKGNNVQHLNINDRVYGFYDEGLSSHAEYVAVSVKKAILKIPDGVSYQQAAASLEGAHYAYYFLNELNLKPGDSVLVNGGTGAIGNAALQFLKHYGVTVTITCETDNVDLLKAQGADRVIDYITSDFTKIGEQFDYVFDAVGKSTFAKCKPLLKTKGIYISSELGLYWQNIWLALLSPAMRDKKVKFPLPGSIHQSLKFIDELLDAGKFMPLTDKTYKLDKIQEAYKYVLSGQKKGNIVVMFD